MKTHRTQIQIRAALYLLLSSCSILLSAQQLPDSVFAHYFRNAQTFADTYPREKTHLHFDNTSYFLGDTLWFKAYVTMAEDNLPSVMSKPLYVELLDQLGNVKDRQIIELNKGVGHGQLILHSSYMSGYYEVRAYTRWMLAFDEKNHFSRTFPLYEKLETGTDSQKKNRDLPHGRLHETTPFHLSKNVISSFLSRRWFIGSWALFCCGI